MTHASDPGTLRRVTTEPAHQRALRVRALTDMFGVAATVVAVDAFSKALVLAKLSGHPPVRLLDEVHPVSVATTTAAPAARRHPHRCCTGLGSFLGAGRSATSAVKPSITWRNIGAQNRSSGQATNGYPCSVRVRLANVDTRFVWDVG